MTRYQLAKLVSWAERLETRKRLQKVVYLLQAAGCPLDADYSLHHYGPYSQEVARLSDEMVKTALLAEETEQNAMGQQYSYHLTEHTKRQVADLEATPEGRGMAQELAPFEAQAKDLLKADLKELEVASTMVYFRRQGYDWPEAVARTGSFKNLPLTAGVMKRAEDLAHRVVR
jgi:uncharacterized protein